MSLQGKSGESMGTHDGDSRTHSGDGKGVHRVLRRPFMCATALAGTIAGLSMPLGGALAGSVTINSTVAGTVYGNSAAGDPTVLSGPASGNSLTIQTGADVSDMPMAAMSRSTATQRATPSRSAAARPAAPFTAVIPTPVTPSPATR